MIISLHPHLDLKGEFAERVEHTNQYDGLAVGCYIVSEESAKVIEQYLRRVADNEKTIHP